MSDLPERAQGVLRLFEISQTGIDLFSDQLIEDVQGGNLNPLELRAMVKSLELIIERVNKATQDNQLRAADLFPGSSFEACGVKFTKGDIYTSYNFEGCNDPEWMLFSQQVISAKKSLSEREAFLKTLKVPLTFVDKETGEAITINPPVKKSTPGLKVSIR